MTENKDLVAPTTDSPSTRTTSDKVFAVLVFLTLIFCLSWISVQLVNLVPGSFASLASLAESVNPYRDQPVTIEPLDDNMLPTTLDFINKPDSLDSGKASTLSWKASETPGNFTFAYNCVGGASLTITDLTGTHPLACDTTYNLGNINNTNVTISADTELSIPYTLTFLGTNDTTPRAIGTGSFTVKPAVVVKEEVKTEEATQTPEPAKTAIVTVEPEPVLTYEIPVSNPRGNVDLSTTFIQVGKITGGKFVAGRLTTGENGAVQFSVKNYGTKTSDKWSFTIELPDGTTYESSLQSPLKPNERAVLSVGFETTDRTSHTFIAKVEEPNDRHQTDNVFSERVTIYR